ncbi:MAG: hypothetical protein CMG57_05370 [Candidatus Marinimicrobia bacterium]|nr:hypothetical protein [Candidatus Neomarinimicrobiota bacterium]|tara:strand:+ start:1561 stop:2052 length:492 start_codon:yes stop_codon:yes gene_type:complete
MRSKSVTNLLFLHLILLLTGCYRPSITTSVLNQHSYKYYLGIATAFTFQKQSEEILLKHGYKVSHYDNQALFLAIDTDWKDRQLTETERKKSYHESKTKILLTATKDLQSSKDYKQDLYSCYMDVINMCSNNINWIEFYRSPELKLQIDSIAHEIQFEFQNLF